MLARRSLLATALNAAAFAVVAVPAMAEGDTADPSLAAFPTSTGSPRTRGPLRRTPSATASAEAPSVIRSSGSPSSRGPRRLGISEETLAGTAAPR